MFKGLRSGVQPVAVKVLNEHTPKQLADFQREINILRSLHDTNVVQFLGVCQRQVSTLHHTMSQYPCTAYLSHD